MTIITAATDNISDLISLLKPLGSKVGNCTVSEDGLQFVIEIDKILLIQTWIPSSLFAEFNCIPGQFAVDVGLLYETLSVFDTRVVLQSTADELILASDADIYTRISLKKYDKTHISTNMFSESAQTKIIIKSDALSVVFGDLDASCNLIAFLVSENSLIMRSIGSFGETEIKFDKDSDVIDSFDTVQNVSVSYNFSLFKYCVKALSTSKKTCIRINHDGILSLQFMIPLSNESRFTFIEFAVISITNSKMIPAFSD